jgi:hypothetical protein
VSSRSGAPVPQIGPARRLAEAAAAAGWTTAQTYALARVPPRHYASGEVRRSSHLLATVAVRLRRPPSRWAWAMWRSEDDGPWRFDHAYLGVERVGLRVMMERIKG